MKTSKLRERLNRSVMNRAFDHGEAVELAAEVIKLRSVVSEFVSAYAGFEDADGNPCPTVAKARALLTEHDE